MTHSPNSFDFFIEKTISLDPVDYQFAIDTMQTRVASIHKGTAAGLLWFLEHPPLYTAGTSAKDEDLLSPSDLPVYKVGRGGQYTYHGPGQLVVYCLVDLKAVDLDIRQYVKTLEHWILRVLLAYGITGALYPDRIGVWVTHPETRKESKIAAIGVRVTHGVTWHGLSFNITTNLDHYRGIVPCGISDFGATSLLDQGVASSIDEVICAFCATIPTQFIRKASK